MLKPKNNSFSKKKRLCRQKEIQYLFSHGESFYIGIFRFKYLINTKGYSRFLITISKKVGNAVVRNRLKRLFREVIRFSENNQKYTIDCAICLSKSFQDNKLPSLFEIKKKLNYFFINLNFKNPNGSRSA